MWNRKEIKKRGKSAFVSNYWLSVGVSAISLAASIAIALIKPQASAFAKVTYWIILFFSVFISIGVNKFFLDNSRDVGTFTSFKNGFSKNCGKNLSTAFVMYMRIAIIPGIIMIIGLATISGPFDSRVRIIIEIIFAIIATIISIIISYDYKMVYYILVDKPNLPTNEVLELSKAMMKGNKMKTFIFDLSFLGWNILGVASCFILSLFYVFPYESAADAELYIAIRSEYEEKEAKLLPEISEKPENKEAENNECTENDSTY